MLLSIIIPMYNGAEYIGECLNSIFAAKIPEDIFEVICVDDVSPDPKQNAVVEKLQGEHPNIKLIRHSTNKRQGGARNTGVKIAKGDFIAYIDQDDTFNTPEIPNLIQALKDNHNLDILMVTGASLFESGKLEPFNYKTRNSQELMTGFQFIVEQEVPWCPWCYIYKRNFLLSKEIFFVDNVRFEDMDYVMKTTVSAEKIKFIPINLIRYHISSNQTTFFGNDFVRIHDWLNMTDRVKQVALSIPSHTQASINAASAVLNHYKFSYNAFLKRYAWRLSYKNIISLLKEYPPYCGDSAIMRLANKPVVYASLARTIRPMLLTAWKLKRFYKK